MHEQHKHEQYFFDSRTINHLADFTSGWDNPCFVCAPMLGKAMGRRTNDSTILDVDDRFAAEPGFQKFDITAPKWNGRVFGLIVCDPPFFNVSLKVLCNAIRVLSRFETDQPLLISYLTRRATAFQNAFQEFRLKPTGYFPTYQSVNTDGRNRIEFFSNLSATQLEPLKC